MKTAILILALLILAGFAAAQAVVMYQKKADLQRALAAHLDAVGDATDESLRKTIVAEAARLGVRLTAADVRLTYEDTQARTYPQQLLEGRVAQFTNKRVSISAHYSAQILGISIPQEARVEKLKTIQTRSVAPTLDSMD